LFLKSALLRNDEVRAATAERFRAAGLDPERLVMEGSSPFEEYLKAYHAVDIVLDPFPYTGGTTTAQALWMGVPVLTLAGDRLLGRQGEAMLRVLGLDDWVARDDTDYLQRAVRHAGSINALAVLRAGLRARMETSPLMDAPRFAVDLEAAFRDMWSRWCAASAGSGGPLTAASRHPDDAGVAP
jgi:predicted O-linked N-acetylglucosamine transferase (SPINDLY family)